MARRSANEGSRAACSGSHVQYWHSKQRATLSCSSLGATPPAHKLCVRRPRRARVVRKRPGVETRARIPIPSLGNGAKLPLLARPRERRMAASREQSTVEPSAQSGGCLAVLCCLASRGRSHTPHTRLAWLCSPAPPHLLANAASARDDTARLVQPTPRISTAGYTPHAPGPRSRAQQSPAEPSPSAVSDRPVLC